MPIATQEKVELLTLEKIEDYFKSFFEYVHKNRGGENVQEILTKYLSGIRLPWPQNKAVVAVQMHIFKIPIERIEEDFSRLRQLITALENNKEWAEETYNSLLSSEMTHDETAVAFANTLIIFWNNNYI